MQRLRGSRLVLLYGVGALHLEDGPRRRDDDPRGPPTGLPRIREVRADDNPGECWDFIVIEHLGGGTLRDLLLVKADDGDQAWPWSERLRLLSDVAEGMAQMHSKAYVHRDLKPANVLIDEYGRGKIADLGLAHDPGGDPSHRNSFCSFISDEGDDTDLARLKAIGGTPPYMSPENVHAFLAAGGLGDDDEDGGGDAGGGGDCAASEEYDTRWLSVRKVKKANVQADAQAWGKGKGAMVPLLSVVGSEADAAANAEAAGRAAAKDKDEAASLARRRRCRAAWHAPDSYAFGVIMFEVLTLRVPWDGVELRDMWARVEAGKRPAFTRGEASRAPPSFVALMSECWHGDPARRPRFAAILARLQRMAGGRAGGAIAFDTGPRRGRGRDDAGGVGGGAPAAPSPSSPPVQPLLPAADAPSSNSIPPPVGDAPGGGDGARGWLTSLFDF